MMYRLARWLGLLPTLGSNTGLLSPQDYVERERALRDRLRRLERLAIEADVIKRRDSSEWAGDPSQDGGASFDADQTPDQPS
jgi:hypothetical protein